MGWFAIVSKYALLSVCCYWLHYFPPATRLPRIQLVPPKPPPRRQVHVRTTLRRRRIPYRQVREQARQRLAGAQQTYRLTKFTYSSPSPTEPRISFRRDQKVLKLCRGLRQTHRWNFASITERGKIGSCSIRLL